LKIKVRPAGLEPATPCLEDGFEQSREKPNSPGNFALLYSIRYEQVVVAC